SSDAGGIHFENTGSSLNMDHSTINGNHALSDGGGVDMDNEGPVTLTFSSISGNTCGSSSGANGGGLANAGGVTLTSSHVDQNTATAAGGGIFEGTSGVVRLIDSTVNFNRAANDVGGGINAGGNDVIVTRSSVSNNACESSGGGIGNAANVTVTDGHV